MQHDRKLRRLYQIDGETEHMEPCGSQDNKRKVLHAEEGAMAVARALRSKPLLLRLRSSKHVLSVVVLFPLEVPAESPNFSLDILLKELSSPKYTLKRHINDRKETLVFRES